MSIYIHPTAEVHEQAKIGDLTKIWHHTHVREGAQLGEECIVGQYVHIDNGVTIGNRCKIQNNAILYNQLTLEDGVFVGPCVCFTNDKHPRAINPDGTLKTAAQWELTHTYIKEGASIGANSTILPGITIGKWAMIGAGSVVTKDVPDYALVVGNPAKIIGSVNKEGRKIDNEKKE